MKAARETNLLRYQGGILFAFSVVKPEHINVLHTPDVHVFQVG